MSEARTIALLEEILSKTNESIRRTIEMERRLRELGDKIEAKKNGGR